jgi:hypothetical protein
MNCWLQAADAAQRKQLLRLKSYKGSALPPINSSSPSKKISKKTSDAPAAAQTPVGITPDETASGTATSAKRATQQEVLQAADEDQLFSLGSAAASGALLAAAAAARWAKVQQLSTLNKPDTENPVESAAVEGVAMTNQQQRPQQLNALVARQADGDGGEDNNSGYGYVDGSQHGGNDVGGGGGDDDDDNDGLEDEEHDNEDDQVWLGPPAVTLHQQAMMFTVFFEVRPCQQGQRRC